MKIVTDQEGLEVLNTLFDIALKAKGNQIRGYLNAVEQGVELEKRNLKRN